MSESPAAAAIAAADGAPALIEEEDSYDASTVRTAQRIPMLSVRAGPRDGAPWRDRLKEEYKALIQYIRMNKENDNDWFVLSADDSGVRCALLAIQGASKPRLWSALAPLVFPPAWLHVFQWLDRISLL